MKLNKYYIFCIGVIKSSKRFTKFNQVIIIWSRAWLKQKNSKLFILIFIDLNMLMRIWSMKKTKKKTKKPQRLKNYCPNISMEAETEKW